MPPTPSADVWNQYTIVAILLFCAGLIAAAFYRLWRELLKWMGEQNAERVLERDKQREWEAEQSELQDERWQLFLTKQQEEWFKQDGRHTEVLIHMIEKMDDLIKAVHDHDLWVRTKGRE